MKDHHVAKLISILSIVAIRTDTQATQFNIVDENRLPSSDGFEIAANGSKAVFMYVRALLFTVPIGRDMLCNILAAREVVKNAITECTLHNR